MPILQNPRHERFAAFLAEGKSALEAYRLAGFKPDTGNAARLTVNDSVKARLAELQRQNVKKTTITVASLADELDAAVAQAEALGQPSVRVSAAALKARLAGLDVKKLEVGGAGEFSHCETAEDVLAKVLQDDDLHGTLEALDTVRAAVVERLAERAKVIECEASGARSKSSRPRETDRSG
jgi:hypothetical protein